jgi:hypothetical protein
MINAEQTRVVSRASVSRSVHKSSEGLSTNLEGESPELAKEIRYIEIWYGTIANN